MGDEDATAHDQETGLDGDVAAAALFGLIWNALADVLGTAAVAAIVRRAVQHAAVECPELVDVVVRREQFEYGYALPPAWSRPAPASRPSALAVLAAEIGRLLGELTGSVVINRLEAIPELQGRGLTWRAKEPN